jgi:hypothetical protein
MHPTFVLSPPELRQQAHAHAMRVGLQLLWQAWQQAKHLGQEPWDFSLTAQTLDRAGLTENHLRWLLCHGCVEHTWETTHAHAGRRTFQPVANLRLGPNSCFILTDRGCELAEAVLKCDPALASPTPGVAPQQPETLPLWCADRQELHYGGLLVKKFKQPAANQTTILAAFQEEGWPARIDNPLPPTRETDGAERLHDAIKKLNQCQVNPLLRFHGDGTGQGVTWESVPTASPERPQSGPGRTANRG